MKWYDVREFLPGRDVTLVIVRALDLDQKSQIYQAQFMDDKWYIPYQEYFPDEAINDLTITHWREMPDYEELYA